MRNYQFYTIYSEMSMTKMLNMKLFHCFISAGPHTSDVYKDFRIGSVGKELIGVQTKIADVQEDGSGEVRTNFYH